MILPAVSGLILILAVLLEAFETVVLPRRVVRRLRITVLFYRATWRSWRAIARGIRRKKFREGFLSYYGPLSLLVLFIFWAALLIFGFALVYYSASGSGFDAPALPHLPLFERHHVLYAGPGRRDAAHVD